MNTQVETLDENAVEAELNAARFRFLTEDFDSGDLREARNALLDRMSVMTYPSVCLQIEAILKEHLVKLDLSPDSASCVQHTASTQAAVRFECAASKQGSAGGNYPAECDWPLCGCDEVSAVSGVADDHE